MYGNTATEAAGLVKSDYADETSPEEESVLISLTNEQEWASRNLDDALAALARKVKPIYLSIPEEKDQSDNARPANSPVVTRMVNNTEYTNRQSRLIRQLTKALQV